MRLDNYLVENGFVDSRNKAQNIIKEELVSVNGKIVKKAAFKVEEGDEVNIREHKAYVSRAAYKLLHFLDELRLDVSGRSALDIGSSTGGFTQVLLERGVHEVSCVDVGHDQLHRSLREDSRVSVYEGCDIRKFETQKQFDLIVSDVAFISLHYILNDVQRLASQDIILLFKPQFEVGREVKRDKNGVVLDKKAIERAMQKFEDTASLQGWKLLQKSPSQLSGKEGNQEWCYYFKK
ncbi:23S rRNA (cytidine-2'-O)-methyltransferase TlyA [Sulfurimonas paralvinellae]|uniref:TlyA family RNA methyltransferase n=1 Tax=Sulfurimonas paralvinellae TaxID=317658 RepID=A0A7M1B7F2_9BACT|nr:TlyA family RNA methyltransferase [Sulfurimonas paralvinellae]QOP45436.1 TlyA family RNA methyltransferase [Sulfurimonas paralvinellae]